MFLLGIAAVPWFIVRVPDDYFVHSRRPDPAWRVSWLRWVWLAAKNLLGLGFLFMGILMLVLPGQGILTILIALTLLDFPGKFRLERWVVTRRGVLDSINWVRKRNGRKPLVVESWMRSGDAS
jgi:hypothetical protein